MKTTGVHNTGNRRDSEIVSSANLWLRAFTALSRCLPDSPKPVSPKPDSPKLGFRVRVSGESGLNRYQSYFDSGNGVPKNALTP